MCSPCRAFLLACLPQPLSLWLVCEFWPARGSCATAGSAVICYLVAETLRI